MKKYLIKSIFAFLLALGLTALLYWPLYQKIPLGNSTSNIDSEVSRLDLSLGDEIKEILDRKIDLPKDRHELCLKNQNGFHFIHADSNTPCAPFLFYTNDLNQNDFGKKNKLGAMAINLYYQNNLPEDENYREFGWPKKCIVLDTTKLKNYASSTIEYSYLVLNRQEEFDLGSQGKLSVLRPVAGYFVDTAKSSAYIIARWKFFLLTLGALFVILFTLFSWLLKYFQKIYSNVVDYLKRIKK